MKKTILATSACLVLAAVWVWAQSQQVYTRNIHVVAGHTFSTLPGFEIERLNPPDRNDSYVVLTFDSNGQPVVEREYDVPVRLLDQDGDGIYETEQVITDKIDTCQGLWFNGPTMYATCHAVLESAAEVERAAADVAARIENQTPVEGSTVRAPGGGGNNNSRGPERFRSPNASFFKVTDNDGDGVGDSVEQVAQLVGRVSDHGPHAIRRGPGGEVMFMSGNNGGTPLNEYLDPNSLILGDTEAQFLPTLGGNGGSLRDGVHSALYRVDLENRKFYVLTGGDRNTYDFAYNLLGEAFWYDSDHEPEIGVPWYRQVRSVHGIPGGNYGYRNNTGKLPPWYIDTLPPLRDLDRGSPVGVETYQSYAYPAEFYDMLLEADWSRGRLLYTTLAPNGASYKPEPGAPEFVHGEPLNITDLEVGPDGMIYFTTGGRATDGGFWRIRYTGETPTQPDMTGILAVVRQPQPLSAWSWNAIEDRKAEMGAERFASELERVARDASMDQWDRVRAVYEMQRHGIPPSTELLSDLMEDTNANVRAAAVYVTGMHTSDAHKQIAAAALRDRDPMVLRRAAEALVRQGLSPDQPSFAPMDDLFALLNNSDRFVRWSGRIAIERTPRSEWADRVLSETNPLGAIEGMLAWARTADSEPMEPILEKQLTLMRQTDLSTENKLRLLRTFMYTTTEMEDGLRPEMREQVYDAISPQFPANDVRMNREMALILAYSKQPEAIGKILAAMPQGDEQTDLQIHYAYALRYIDEGWTQEQKMRFADWFHRTSNWRGGMGSGIRQIWDAAMEFYTDDEKEMAYERAPGYAPLEELDPGLSAELAAAFGGRGGGGGGGRGGRNPVRQSKEEEFESALYRADRRGGDFGGRNEPADPEAGLVAFGAQCSSCHRVGNTGNDYGPDLTARPYTRREILEAIYWPERKIDEEYRNTVVETADGGTIRGLLVGETETALTLKTSGPEPPVDVQKSQVRSQRKEMSTIMPDLFDVIERNAMNEIVAYLQSDIVVASNE